MKDIAQWDLLQDWIGASSKILIKKLSRNDCRWADDPNNHQSGVYIPVRVRSEKYFPQLVTHSDPSKTHIKRASFKTFWPVSGEIKSSWLRHFTNKGSEAHLTRLPKSEFANLTPASLMVGGVLKKALHDGICYWFIVVDSSTEVAELLETRFELAVDFECDLFDPDQNAHSEFECRESLIYEINSALSTNTLASFINTVSRLPSSEALASEAQNIYLKSHGLKSLDPYSSGLKSPGDAIMKISRDIEFRLYKYAELRHRAADVIRIITEGDRDLVTAIVKGFPQLDASFLSASQHRKSRAGRSFERHIGRLLIDGGVLFKEQVVTGGRRPDFVSPNETILKSKDRSFNEALVLSAKTTLRERWKQVAMEDFNCALFLATVDDRISSDAINDMGKKNICLVVPESLKVSSDTCYKDKANVITFRNFFDEEISRKRPFLMLT